MAVVAAVLAGSLATSIGAAGGVRAASTDVVFNEIMYHPADDNPNAEYIEFFNRGNAAVDISHWCVDGVKYCFRPGTTIGARSFLVVTSAFFDGALSNGGEELQLIDAAGNVIERFEYDDKKDWPALADGEGQSLQRLDVNSDADNSGNWQAHPPTPGTANAKRSAPMPVFSKVTHTTLPAPGEPIDVTAKLDGATSATLLVRVGFGPVLFLPTTVADGEVSARIPGQAAGSLVRYRLVATSSSGVIGGWPRQGDGAQFTGTTVARPLGTDLPLFEWFMTDADYDVARQDLTLRGDNGYLAILAYDGEIFDNTRVRVKGQASRGDLKKKWKFVLPAGHELEIDGLLPEGIDEFALHSSWSDKSFLRETLAAEFMESAGIPASQAFPVRLDRNGQFFGLYTYVEQQDGTWRDRFDLDDSTVYEVGGSRQFGGMDPFHANLGDSRLREKYDKETNEFESDDKLRELIRTLNGLRGTALRNWILDNVDVASVINTLAVSSVIAHQDIGHKNYRVALDEHDRWHVIPTDFDLTFGRKWSFGCAHLCREVGIQGSFEHPGQPLFAPFWFDPVLNEMLLRRIRTVSDELFVPSQLNGRVAQLKALVADEANADRQVWGTTGFQQSPAAAADEIITRFVVPQSQRLAGSLAQQGRVASPAQVPNPRIAITSVQYDEAGGNAPHVVITNLEPTMIDVSGYAIEALDVVVTGGTVLQSGQSAVLVHKDAGSLVGAFRCCRIGGIIRDDIDEATDGFELTDRRGAVVDAWRLLPPGQLTELEGRPNSSALVSLVAADTHAGGYLQVLDCDADPQGTSNLNVDGFGQTRAGATVVRFDSDGRACIYNRSAMQVIADVQGYFADGAIDDVDDVRLLDTRGGPKPASGSVQQVSGPASTTAVVSLVATETAGGGFLQVVPCTGARDSASNLNYDAANQTRSGLAVVSFDAAGQACLFVKTAAHLVADMQALLADGTVDDIIDQRIIDTRAGARPAGGSVVEIAGRPNTSALASIVATESTGPGYLAVTDCATPAGTVSNVNVDRAGQSIQNLAVVRFDDAGRACVFVHTATHVIVDIQAYLESAAFDDIPDERLVDTRNR